MIFVNSSVWIDYFNGRSTAPVACLDHLLGREPIAIGDLVLVEVLQGFRHDRDYRTARSLLGSLQVLNVLNTAIAIASADNYRLLRKRGVTVRKTVDTIIATFCIVNGLWLLHSDQDFRPFEVHLGLKVVR